MCRYPAASTIEKLAVEAVIGEPVSASYFPVLQEIQGNFGVQGWSRGGPRIRKRIQGVPSKFPKNPSREFRGLNRELHLA
jgi:hypothetical protein